MLILIAGEEMNTVLDDRTTEGSAQLLIRIRKDALGDKIRGVERVIPEISCESAREDIRSRLRDCIDKHAGGAPLAGVKPV